MYVGFSPLNEKPRILSNSFFSPVARFTSAILFCAGVALVAPPTAPAPPRPPAPRLPRPPAAADTGYSVNAAQRESPLMTSELPPPPAAPPRPPPPASPIGYFISLPSAPVERMITVASPSLGARTYANHLPSLDKTVWRIDFHALRSAGCICLVGPAPAAGCCAQARVAKATQRAAARAAAREGREGAECMRGSPSSSDGATSVKRVRRSEATDAPMACPCWPKAQAGRKAYRYSSAGILASVVFLPATLAVGSGGGEQHA